MAIQSTQSGILLLAGLLRQEVVYDGYPPKVHSALSLYCSMIQYFASIDKQIAVTGTLGLCKIESGGKITVIKPLRLLKFNMI